VVVYGAPQTISTLRAHFFNNFLWPDFTAIPTKEHPVLSLETLIPGRDQRVGGYTVRPIPVNHPVESMAFVIRTKGRAIVFSGDTGPTDLLWKEINRMRNVRAVFVDTSFPNRLQELADVSGHLTPQTLDEQIRKIDRPESMAILAYHLKPAYVSALTEEIAALGRDYVRVTRLGDVYEF
jgi:cAMP phosphodiesterase